MASSGIRLWDDNPSLIDLLGFDAVVEPVLSALATPDLDPLAIGVQSPWGGGKSTVLNLLDSRLKDNPHYVVIRTDPWEYDDHQDVRGTLIGEILDVVRARFDSTSGVVDRVKELTGRVSWRRAGLALAAGALTMQWNPDTIIEAFRPRERSSPESMSGFRDAFGELIQTLPNVTRVVVLVDDLDRCLPEAVMATLESIKLFLSVPKMVFVLAADQDMVRDAIAASLDATNRSEKFASRYLEKIVQLPVSLPRLAPHDAEAYIGLLLAYRDRKDDDSFKALIDHCGKRRDSGQTPLLGDMKDLTWKPAEDLLLLSAQLSQGLSADKLSNPRQIKRFLNAFGVRGSIADARRVNITPNILVKMLLLEDLHRSSFEALAASSPSDRRELLSNWEAWARGEVSDRPSVVAEDTRYWAAAEPSLIGQDLDTYLNLAASLMNVQIGSQVSDEVGKYVQSLLGEGDAARAAAVQQLSSLPDHLQHDAMDLLLANIRRLEDPTVPLGSAIEWARFNVSLVNQVVSGVRDSWTRLTAGIVVDLASSEVQEFVSLVSEAASDDRLDSMTREAAKLEIGS